MGWPAQRRQTPQEHHCHVGAEQWLTLSRAEVAPCCSYQGTGRAGSDVSHSQVLHCFILAVCQVLAFGNGGTVILAVILDNVSGMADTFNPSLQVLVKHSESPT